MSSTEGDGSRRISVDLPVQLIERFDELKQQWGLRRRGAVLERLLEVVLCDDHEIDDGDSEQNSKSEVNASPLTRNNSVANNSPREYLEDSAIVLIGNSDIESFVNEDNSKSKNKDISIKKSASIKGGIDLPVFVRNNTNNLRRSLSKENDKDLIDEPFLCRVSEESINNCVKDALNHWISLYGSKPKDNVVEAAMIWLARDIWPNLEGTLNCPFTWRAATKLMSKHCSSWTNVEPTFDRIIVLSGFLEDPFAASSLSDRIPTLVRRFVSSFKRRQNVTSFQTLESTMTVHGALKLLSLPTTAGASLSLVTIREAYKNKAVDNHPDSGGSTDTMRRINEAYQLLKELYRKS